MSRLFKQGIACLVLLVSGQALATEAADPGFSLIPVPLMSLSGEEAFLPGERVVVDLGENETMRESVTWLAGLISEQTGHELLVSGPGEAGGGIRLALAGEKAMLEKFKAAGLMPPGQVAEAYSLSVAPAAGRIPGMARPGDTGCARVCLARPDARFGPPHAVGGIHQAAPGLDVAA
jgi:hypothetical protein